MSGYREHDECKDKKIRFYKGDNLIEIGLCRFIGYLKCKDYKEKEECYKTDEGYYVDYCVKCDEVDKEKIKDTDTIEVNKDYIGEKILKMKIINLSIMPNNSVEFTFRLKEYIHEHNF